MVGVAQLVERLTVAQVVVGSNPIAHPTLRIMTKILKIVLLLIRIYLKLIL